MAAIKPLAVTRADLHRSFEYRDGVLYWRDDRRKVKPGDVAGGVNSQGYWIIKIDGRIYRRSRLVWMYVTGKDSYPLSLDHKNRIRTDDAIHNLIPATHAENQRNRSWGASVARYVTYTKAINKWRAIASEGHPRVRKYLGTFNTENEAIEAVKRWEAAIV